MMRYRYGPATINMMILPSHPMIQAGPEGTTPLFPKPATLQEHYNPLRDRGCTSACTRGLWVESSSAESQEACGEQKLGGTVHGHGCMRQDLTVATLAATAWQLVATLFKRLSESHIPSERILILIFS